MARHNVELQAVSAIVAPTPWFGTTALQNIDPKDLIPDDWTQLSW